MSAAPGNQTPTVPADTSAAGRRRPLVAAAVAAGLLAVVVGAWALTRGGGGTDAEGTAVGVAVPSPAGTDPTAPNPTAAPDTAAGSSTTGAPDTTGGTDSLLDPSLLATVLISAADLGGFALPLDDTAVASGQDPEHPLTDYGFCNRPLDRSQAGAAAKRVLTKPPVARRHRRLHRHRLHLGRRRLGRHRSDGGERPDL